VPEMDGIQLAKAIYEQAPQTRVIVISGYEEFEYAREAFRWGVKDYLLKPVDIDELLTILQKLKVGIIKNSTMIKFNNISHNLF
jgi:two-component system, response regulator YesN